MMKGLTKLIILAAVIFVVCIPVVSAFDVEGLTIDPSGALTPNTPVTVSFKVGFAATSGETFPSGSDLVLTTDLANPKWTYTLILDGVENPRNPVGGKTLDLSGFELSYPAKVDESVRVTVEGTAPTVDTTSNKTVLDIHEVDTHGNIVTSTQITKTAMVINPGQINQAINDKTANLQTFRSHIDEKSAIGIDTTDAEADYNDANAKISSAKARPATQYTDALNDLTAAQASIDAGETALDKSWAESDVANAQGPVDNVDKVIAWFKGNQSTANDPQLSAIVAKREVAVNYISNANDFITNGKYSDARSKAAEAFAKGNESYTDALARQYTLMHGGFDIIGAITGIFKSGILVIVVGIVAVVLIAVGVIIYRKRSRWDELG
jgi:hypothetical protein